MVRALGDIVGGQKALTVEAQRTQRKALRGCWDSGYGKRLAAGAEGLDECEVVEEIDVGIVVEIGGRVVAREGLDEVEVVEEVNDDIAVEVYSTNGEACGMTDCLAATVCDNAIVHASVVWPYVAQYQQFSARGRIGNRIKDHAIMAPLKSEWAGLSGHFKFRLLTLRKMKILRL